MEMTIFGYVFVYILVGSLVYYGFWRSTDGYDEGECFVLGLVWVVTLPTLCIMGVFVAIRKILIAVEHMIRKDNK